MSKSILTAALLLASAILAAQNQPVHRTVVVISLDGFPAFALQDPKSKVLTELPVSNVGYVVPAILSILHELDIEFGLHRTSST